MSTSSPFWCETCSSVIGPPPSRLMSPITRRGRVRVRRAVRGGHRDDRANRVLGAVQPLRCVRHPVRDRVPGDPVRAVERELRPVGEAAGPRQPGRDGVVPGDRRRGLGSGRGLSPRCRRLPAGWWPDRRALGHGQPGPDAKRQRWRIVEEDGRLGARAASQRRERDHDRGRQRDRGRPCPAQMSAPLPCRPPHPRGDEPGRRREARDRRGPHPDEGRDGHGLAEPEHLRLEPHLAASPAHGPFSFGREPPYPPGHLSLLHIPPHLRRRPRRRDGGQRDSRRAQRRAASAFPGSSSARRATPSRTAACATAAATAGATSRLKTLGIT